MDLLYVCRGMRSHSRTRTTGDPPKYIKRFKKSHTLPLSVIHAPHTTPGPLSHPPLTVSPIHPTAHARQSVPDEESRSARWVTRAELLRLPLRSQELVQWIDYLEAGGAVYPLSLFAGEHEPVPVPGSS